MMVCYCKVLSLNYIMIVITPIFFLIYYLKKLADCFNHFLNKNSSKFKNDYMESFSNFSIFYTNSSYILDKFEKIIPVIIVIEERLKYYR